MFKCRCMCDFWLLNQNFWGFLWIFSLILSKIVFDARHLKNGLKGLLGILRNGIFLVLKMQNMQIHEIDSLDFSEILCDDRHSKRSKSDCFFYFSGQLWLYTKLPSLVIFGYKNDMCHISCFIALFFVLVLFLKPVVH